MVVSFGMLASLNASSLDNAADNALGEMGLKRSTAQFDKSISDFYRNGLFRSPFYEACFSDVWRTPYLLEVTQEELTFANQQPHKTISLASRLTDSGVRRDLLGDPAGIAAQNTTDKNSFRVALERMKQRGLITTDIPPTDSIPLEVQSAAAVVLQVMMDSEPYREAAFAEVQEMSDTFKRAITTDPDVANPVMERRSRREIENMDLAPLYAGAQDIAAAVQVATTRVTTLEGGSFMWRLTTALGDIVLSSGSDNMYVDQKILLCIDLSGKDTYINCPTNQTVNQWLSVVIDRSGDDKYLSSSGFEGKTVAEATTRKAQRGLPGPGSATMGYTFLIDMEGNDLYRSARSSFGSATFGVAFMRDSGGDDIYDVYGESLGYGKFGIGILEDVEGKDIYTGFTQCQGIGMPGGVGLLIDQSGDDTYLADDTVIDFPSAQSAEHNVSMAQGAGYGRRMDYVDGRSIAGGIGMLIDTRGNDSYTCGVFGQGTGYWMGVGVLTDKDGNDKYTGQWYVQGAAAHFGIGYLQDRAGKDEYTAYMNMAQGAGHDFSVGYLIDESGDDLYLGTSLSLGAGNANGIGIFFDLDGADTYTAKGNDCFGRARANTDGSLRSKAFSLGFFYDGGGRDTYPAGYDWIDNAKRSVGYATKNDRPEDSALGIFYDR